MDDAPFDGDPSWRVVRELRDGTPVTIRPITPGDREGLRRAFHEASPQTRYLRFGLAAGTLSDAALTYLTCVDQEDHVALVATTTTPDLKDERGVGVARFVRSKHDRAVAEAAVAVIDDLQSRGLGRVLCEELGKAAIARGIRRLHAEVLHANTTMRAILERVGAKAPANAPNDGLSIYALDLAPFISRSKG